MLSASLINLRQGNVSDGEDDEDDAPVGPMATEPEEWEHGTGHDYDGFGDGDDEGF